MQPIPDPLTTYAMPFVERKPRTGRPYNRRFTICPRIGKATCEVMLCFPDIPASPDDADVMLAWSERDSHVAMSRGEFLNDTRPPRSDDEREATVRAVDAFMDTYHDYATLLAERGFYVDVSNRLDDQHDYRRRRVWRDHYEAV